MRTYRDLQSLSATAAGAEVLFRLSFEKNVRYHYGIVARSTRGMGLYLSCLYGIFFKLNFPATKMLPKAICTI